jgi:hypothetical protein
MCFWPSVAGSAHGVVPEDGEEHGRGAGEHRAEAGVVVGSVDVEDSQPDDEEDENDLDGDDNQLEASEGLRAATQDEGHEQNRPVGRGRDPLT